MNTTASGSTLRSTERRNPLPSVVVLVACGLAITIGLLLSPTAPNQPLTLGSIPLPQTCASVRDFGIECPGCGLTRSWVSALHGRLAESFAHHRLGWLILLYAMTQILRHGLLLAQPDWRPMIEAKFGKYLDRALVLVAGLLFLNWLPYLWKEILLPMW